MKTRLTLAGLTAAVAATLPAVAEVKVNDNFALSGYVVGAYTNTKIDGAGSNDTFFDSGVSNFDAAKLTAVAKFDPVSITASAFYIPKFTGADDEVGLLDAYATYTAGSVSFTGGKFLSYLGYEAFDPINMTQLTYGSTIFAIPAYHTGVKFDVTNDAYGYGVAAVDSVNPGSGFFQGDGEIADDVGFEAYFTYKGIKDLTVFTGIAFEDTDGTDSSLAVFDIWASYKVSDKVTVAGEFDTSNDVGTGVLGLVQYSFTDKFSVIGRGSAAYFRKGKGNDVVAATVAPTYTFNQNFSLRAEATFSTYDTGPDATFYGVQAVLKF